MPGSDPCAPPAAIILAAGAGSRLGQDKARLRWAGQSFLDRIAGACLTAGLDPVLVVTGAYAADHIAGAWEHPHRFIVNPEWRAGRTGSIQVGLRASAAAPGWLLWPVDIPRPDAALVRALLAARRERPDAALWIPSGAGRRGHPILFGPELAAAFLKLAPDASPRPCMAELPAARIVEVEVGDAELFRDVDTPEDLARLHVANFSNDPASPVV